ncbi:hypothetical protein F4809DRAFT_656575 [Biscogniauxia mediterranea]|nr:hypothetical protein F4809DRAFT_656575 [Biscogniauxia mediterranea]
MSHVTDLDNHQFTVNYTHTLLSSWLEIVKQDPLPPLELTLKPRQSPSSIDNSTSLVLAAIPGTDDSMNNAPAPLETLHNDRAHNQELNKAQEPRYEHYSSDNNSEASNSRNNALGSSSSNWRELMILRQPNTYQVGAPNHSSGQELLAYKNNDTYGLATTAYTLNSFTGALVKRDEYLKSQQKQWDRRGSEDTNDLSEKTLNIRLEALYFISTATRKTKSSGKL